MTTILIVEDNEKNMKLVRDVLRHKGYDTIEAVTGEEGWRLVQQARPDLVLMDIQLPDVDGITVLGRIRADARFDAMPVVAVSASVMPAEVSKIAGSGFDEFVTKPISLKPFLATVERFITGGRRST